MIRLMTESADRDPLDLEIDVVLHENRIVLERTRDTGRRLIDSWYAYTAAVEAVFDELGVVIPGVNDHRPTPSRRWRPLRCRGCPRR